MIIETETMEDEAVVEAGEDLSVTGITIGIGILVEAEAAVWALIMIEAVAEGRRMTIDGEAGVAHMIGTTMRTSSVLSSFFHPFSYTTILYSASPARRSYSPRRSHSYDR